MQQKKKFFKVGAGGGGGTPPVKSLKKISGIKSKRNEFETPDINITIFNWGNCTHRVQNTGFLILHPALSPLD